MMRPLVDVVKDVQASDWKRLADSMNLTERVLKGYIIIKAVEAWMNGEEEEKTDNNTLQP